MQNNALSLGAKTKPRHNCAATSVQILLCRSKRTGKALRIKASVAASTMLIFAALFHGLYSSLLLPSATTPLDTTRIAAQTPSPPGETRDGRDVSNPS